MPAACGWGYGIPWGAHSDVSGPIVLHPLRASAHLGVWISLFLQPLDC